MDSSELCEEMVAHTVVVCATGLSRALILTAGGRGRVCCCSMNAVTCWLALIMVSAPLEPAHLPSCSLVVPSFARASVVSCPSTL